VVEFRVLVHKTQIERINVKLFVRRVPILLFEKAEDIFRLQPLPKAAIVDIEGTLTEFGPSTGLVIQAILHFDQVALRNGFVNCIHYVTNTSFNGNQCPTISQRFHPSALKPFFAPPKELLFYGRDTLVVGDQYLTDGLLAWLNGFSFALTKPRGHSPIWPRIQRSMGWIVSQLFFRRTTQTWKASVVSR
jgi:hypothetical protein